MQQRSKEWFDARKGLFTASEIHNILKPKGFGSTGESYIYEKAAEKLGATNPEIKNAAISHGVDWEYTAVCWYEALFNVDISEIGFVKMPKHETGCSPDGWIQSQLKGIEIKCPYTIDKHVRVGAIRSEDELKSYNEAYYWQCKTSMLIMDCEKWDFVSFDPRHEDKYKMFVVELNRVESEDLFIIERVNQAAEMRDELINLITKI